MYFSEYFETGKSNFINILMDNIVFIFYYLRELNWL